MNRDLLKADLRRDEAVRLKPYSDTKGKLTIGVGRNLTDRGITEAECDAMLEHDIDVVAHELAIALPWAAGLSEPRQRALANMAFNMGVPTLRDFKNMLAALEAGDWDKASAEALASRWAGQVGERAKRIAAVFKGE